ncbi:adhesion G protein-coupled receptor F5-like isoform X2 [Amblyraja radiata]|uniref:adhesion G protein-coupled receptor F5-like isoform X2 n=1 Tax=Amblyraja radiata TaxID=386614 RepID=UPI001401EEC1|nr:adhesion G protein-coupled receptor F5-like isoform X2 [Amblyraja radiata]
MGSAGDMRRLCGVNGYGDELNFCLIPEISNLRELTKSPAEVAANFSSLLQELSDVSDNENITEPGNVQAVIGILTTFANATVPVDETDLANFLQTVSAVISDESLSTWTILSDTTVDANPSSQLLQSVETFTSRLNLTNGTVVIKQNNLQLVATKITRDENSPSINETFKSFNITGYNNLSANIFIHGDEFETAEDNVVVIIAYPTWIDILRNNTLFNMNTHFEINSLVMTVTLNRKKTFTMNMTFSLRDIGLDFDTATCAFWDFAGIGAWNNEGCMTSQEGDNIACTCEHLTSFSILMSPLSESNKALDILTEIGIAISIASLLITIIIEAIVWKQVTKNKTSHTRHVAILNIAINLLIANIWFIVASHVSPVANACVAATFFIHFFYLALFFWMFTLGLLLIFRLVFIFHDFSKSTLMGISFSVGYLCPLIISVITIGATYPGNYIREDACWLRWRDSYPILAFVIPALVIIASNVVVLFVVLFKLLRPRIGDRSRGHSEEQETFKQIVRSIVVLTPILGLTWGFGIATFQEKSHIAFDYIFTILNAFQGFFIFLFGTCLDSKVREALLKRFSLSRLSTRTRTVQTSSTGRFRSKPGFAFPGRNKSYNVTSQVASGSKDKSLSYSTLH